MTLTVCIIDQLPNLALLHYRLKVTSEDSKAAVPKVIPSADEGAIAAVVILKSISSA